VFCHESQTFMSRGMRSCQTSWFTTSISPKRPMARVVAVNPDAVVAHAFPAYTAAPTTAIAKNTIQVDFLRMIELLFRLCRPHADARTLSSNLVAAANGDAQNYSNPFIYS